VMYMKREILYYVLIILLPLLGIFSMWRICVYSRKVYTGLDDIWSRAKTASDRESLQKIYLELQEFYKQYCVTRHYGDYARQVAAYINGKLSTL